MTTTRHERYATALDRMPKAFRRSIVRFYSAIASRDHGKVTKSTLHAKAKARIERLDESIAQLTAEKEFIEAILSSRPEDWRSRSPVAFCSQHKTITVKEAPWSGNDGCEECEELLQFADRICASKSNEELIEIIRAHHSTKETK